MILESVEKSKFAQINDKRYYFEDGIISLPFSHPYLNEISKYKQNKEQKVESWIRDEKNNLLKMEKEALLKNHRFSTLQFIYHQMPEFRDLEMNKRCANSSENKIFLINPKKYIFNGYFLDDGRSRC